VCGTMVIFGLHLYLTALTAIFICHGLFACEMKSKLRVSKLRDLSAGIVRSTKMTRTIIVRRNYAHFIKKYSRWVLPSACTPISIFVQVC